MENKVIIANISGFYGDRISAAKEMVTGGSVDYIVGDYLAELTMAILYKSQLRNPAAGYAHTFMKQMEDIMGECLDRKIKVVVNAGGLNPKGLCQDLYKVAEKLGLNPNIAYVTGDNLLPNLDELYSKGATLMHLEKNLSFESTGMEALSANAYLGCWGIVEALNNGANIVVTGRVSDTSVVMGPAAHHFQWTKDNWDALAGAAVAGHIIECGGQASGGNYSNFKEVPTYKKLGFPIAEIFEDGSSIITKHPNTGGLVSLGTVTSQLLYEINAPSYITPDVIAHFDTFKVSEIGKDKVSVTGTKGSPSTNFSKVTVNGDDGYQNSITFLIAGLDIPEKVEILRQGVIDAFEGNEPFKTLDIDFFPINKENPQTNEEALARLQISVVDDDFNRAGKFFTSKIIELLLCSVPGICFEEAPSAAKTRIVHFPALIDKKYLKQHVFVNDKEIEVDEVRGGGVVAAQKTEITTSDFSNSKTQEAYIGDLFATRSGDKGGNANLGVWGKTEASYQFLKAFLSIEKLKEIMKDVKDLEIERYDFPNLLGLNFYIKGFLGDGVAANTKLDKQAKTLGEYLRAKRIEVPVELLS